MHILLRGVKCGFKGGKQDHYCASYGGILKVEYTKTNTTVNKIAYNSDLSEFLEGITILHFSGVSRRSAEIIEDQAKSVTNHGPSLDGMIQLKEEVNIMENC